MGFKFNSPAMNHPILTDTECRDLIYRAQDGDKQAREKLIKSNLKLVYSIVNRFSNRGYEMEDLFQIGVIGLVKAIDKFDLSYNVKFSTYAVPLIIGEVRRFLRDDSPIKVSRSLKRTAYQAKRLREKLRNQLGREATLAEIAASMGLPDTDVMLALEAVRDPASIYEEVYQDEGNSVLVVDQISDKSNSEQSWIEVLNLKEALAKLPPRERQIIFMRYFQEKTQTEIAKIMGVSQVQISRLEKKTLQKIKKIMNDS